MDNAKRAVGETINGFVQLMASGVSVGNIRSNMVSCGVKL